jgi:hypothetical protein
MKRLLYIALSFVAATFVACNDDAGVGEVDLGYLKLVSADVSFTYAGGTGQIVVDTTAPVTAVIAGDGAWAKASVVGKTVLVTAPVYSGVQSRNSSVTISAGDRSVVVPISQSSFAVVLASNSATVAKEGGELMVGYSIQTPAGETPATFSNLGVTVVSDQPWVVGVVDGNQVKLTVAANTKYLGGREATVTLESNNETLAPRFTVSQSGAVITDLTRAQLNAMTWTVFANGEYTNGFTGATSAKTLSTAGNCLFRIDSPLISNYHFYFAWDSENEGVSLYPAKDLTLSGYPTQLTGGSTAAGLLAWATDPDPEYTFYDAATKTFVINSNYVALNLSTGAVTPYGWLDDYFTITE